MSSTDLSDRLRERGLNDEGDKATKQARLLSAVLYIANITNLEIKSTLQMDYDNKQLTFARLRRHIQAEAEKRDAACRIAAESNRKPEPRASHEDGKGKPNPTPTSKDGAKEGPKYLPHAFCTHCKQQGHYERSKDGRPFCPALKAKEPADTAIFQYCRYRKRALHETISAWVSGFEALALASMPARQRIPSTAEMLTPRSWKFDASNVTALD